MFFMLAGCVALWIQMLVTVSVKEAALAYTIH